MAPSTTLEAARPTRRPPVAVLPVVALLLTVLAVVVRWRTLSHDGLLFDDAWVSLGATRGRPGDLLAVSTLHPGFSGLLMAWARLVPNTTTWLAMPALLAGAALPAATVWAARRLDVRTTVAVGVGVLALVAPTHVIYSGRVKPYTLETLAILVLAVALGPISRRRWSLRSAAAWVAVAVVLGTVNAFLLVSVGTAAVLLVLHPCGDRAVRAGAVAVQGVLQLLLLAAMRRSFDHEALEAGWGDVFDGYVELSAGAGLVHELGTHLARVGQVVVVGNRWLALALVLAAAAGLAWEAWRGRHVVVARYLLALPAVALAGSIAGRLPFGTIDQNEFFPGTRASLWLLPSVLVGVALAGEQVATLVGRRGHRARVIVGVAAASVLVVVVVSALRHDVRYLSPGSETAIAIVTDRGDGDLVLVTESARWSLAAVDGAPFEVVPDQASIVGYQTVPDEPGVEVVNPLEAWAGSAAERHVEAAPPGRPWERVFVIDASAGLLDPFVDERHAGLGDLGYRLTSVVSAGPTQVEVWELIASGAVAP